MKLPRLISSIAVVAIVAACGRAASTENGAAAPASPSATEAQATKKPSVITWTGGRISPDPDHITVIDFNATWCGPCRRFAPIFHQVAGELGDRFRFISVDVDKAPETARQFGVSSIPQITVLRPDGTSYSAVGFMGYDEFLAFIDR